MLLVLLMPVVVVVVLLGMVVVLRLVVVVFRPHRLLLVRVRVVLATVLPLVVAVVPALAPADLMSRRPPVVMRVMVFARTLLLLLVSTSPV